jgi:Domain of unknown function (DUF4185)
MKAADFIPQPAYPAAWVLVLILGFQHRAYAGEPIVSAEARPSPEWDAKFQLRDGWIGGDGVDSVAVSPERTLWLFSDTWVGKVRDGRRSDATIVNNTVAVQEGHGLDAKLRFVVRRTADGKPAALVTPADGRGWFWLQAGTCVGGKLYLFLTQIEREGQGVFGFRQVAQWLGVVENPLDDPERWRVEQKRIPHTDFSGPRRLSFGAEVLREGDQVFIYGTDERQGGPGLPDKQMIVARVGADSLADFNAWRFYRDSRWIDDFRQASHLAGGMGNDYSVSPLAGHKRYVVVSTHMGMSDRIVARTAETPWGPWSAPITVFRCPEVKWDRRVFCYGARAHVAESSGDEILVSYVANSFDFWHVAADARLYWPRFVEVRVQVR